MTELATAEIKKESVELEKQNIKNSGERKKQLDLLSIQRESELLEAAIAENEIKQRQRDEEKKSYKVCTIFRPKRIHMAKINPFLESRLTFLMK